VFASFWLIAPKIAGEQRLRNISKVTLATVAMLLGFLAWLVVFTLLVVLLGVTLPASVNPFQNPPLSEGLLTPPEKPFLREIRRGIVLIVVVLAVGAARLTRGWFEDHVIRPAVNRLGEKESLRSLWMRIGLCLFVAGSVFDMGWWLLDKKIARMLGPW